jgi:hypothetical protein
MVSEARRQFSSQRVAEVLAEVGLVLLPEEEKNARLPVVIGRHLVIEPQHLRPATEECRTVGETREVGIQDWPDDLVV